MRPAQSLAESVTMRMPGWACRQPRRIVAVAQVIRVNWVEAKTSIGINRIGCYLIPTHTVGGSPWTVGVMASASDDGLIDARGYDRMKESTPKVQSGSRAVMFE